VDVFVVLQRRVGDRWFESGRSERDDASRDKHSRSSEIENQATIRGK
jgi:hypothetical protein